MCTIYNRIIELCKSKGVSGSRMCLDLGLSKSTLSDIKSGRKKGISVPTAQKIADYFGITVDELYGREVQEEKEKTATESDGFSESDARLIEWFRSLPEEKQKAILSLGGAPEDLAE